MPFYSYVASCVLTLVCLQGKSPFISVTALHQLHILLFFMVVVHVVISILTMALAKWKVRNMPMSLMKSCNFSHEHI
jgi:mlo protein